MTSNWFVIAFKILFVSFSSSCSSVSSSMKRMLIATDNVNGDRTEQSMWENSWLGIFDARKCVSMHSNASIKPRPSVHSTECKLMSCTFDVVIEKWNRIRNHSASDSNACIRFCSSFAGHLSIFKRRANHLVFSLTPLSIRLFVGFIVSLAQLPFRRCFNVHLVSVRSLIKP